MADGPGPFERVYEAHVLGIYRFVYARVGNHPDAEDLTAQVFVRAVELLDLGRDPGQIAAWLYRVAVNATSDYWRAFYRLPLVRADRLAPGWEPSDTAAPQPASNDEEISSRVASLMLRLPEHYRRVLELRFLERLSVADTASAMGISRGNARVLQYRALRRAALLEEGADA